jgi:Zn-dependent M28 family amino/carboxypeptidase
VILAFFSTAEAPHFGTESMGSWQFANLLKQSGRTARVMIALDLVGYYDESADSQQYPHSWMRLFYPSSGDFVAVIGEPGIGPAISWTKRGLISAGVLDVHSFRAPEWLGMARRSDQWAFMEFGMPAVQVTDTAFLRYPFYHDEHDSWEKLDYTKMAQLVSALHGVTSPHD